MSQDTKKGFKPELDAAGKRLKDHLTAAGEPPMATDRAPAAKNAESGCQRGKSLSPRHPKEARSEVEAVETIQLVLSRREDRRVFEKCRYGQRPHQDLTMQLL